jgi:DNA-binding NarL/FixJ family response regulator
MPNLKKGKDMGLKILLADDHKLLREGLKSLIAEQRNMTVIAETEDGRSAVQLAARLMPDIIIMDISMPGLNGIEATRQIFDANPGAKIIALSMHLESRMVFEMLKAGAKGYLLKDCAFEEVIHAIETVASKGTYLSPRIADMVLKDYVNQTPENESSALSVLSAREKEVLQLLAEGKKTREISDVLHISVKTAEFHRQKIMEKLNVHSIAELTKYAIREGLTSL